MKKMLILCVSLFLLIPVRVYAGNGNIKVWVYPNGDRYHKPTCQYAKKGDSFEVTLQDAVEKFKKTPCLECHPPEYEGPSTSTVPVISYKERDDKLIELNKEAMAARAKTEIGNNSGNEGYSDKALNDLKNGNYKASTISEIPEPKPTPSSSNNVATIAIAAAVGSGVTIAANKLMRK